MKIIINVLVTIFVLLPLPSLAKNNLPSKIASIDVSCPKAGLWGNKKIETCPKVILQLGYSNNEVAFYVPLVPLKDPDNNTVPLNAYQISGLYGESGVDNEPLLKVNTLISFGRSEKVVSSAKGACKYKMPLTKGSSIVCQMKDNLDEKYKIAFRLENDPVSISPKVFPFVMQDPLIKRQENYKSIIADLYKYKKVDKLIEFCGRTDLSPNTHDVCNLNAIKLAKDLCIQNDCKSGKRLLESIALKHIPGMNESESFAQYMLAESYDYGRGLPQDEKKAVYWYAQSLPHAGSYVSSIALTGLCQIYYDSIFVNGNSKLDKDPARSYAYCLTAAKNIKYSNDTWPAFLLSAHYFRGVGVERNFVEAYAWSAAASLACKPSDNECKPTRMVRVKSKEKLLMKDKTGRLLKTADVKAHRYYESYIRSIDSNARQDLSK